MKKVCFGIAALMLVISTLVHAAVIPDPHAALVARWKGQDVVPGVVIVKFEGSIATTGTSLLKSGGILPENLRRAGGIALVRAFPDVVPPAPAAPGAGTTDLSGIYFLTLDSRRDAILAAASLAGTRGIAYAEPKFMQHLFDLPNDPVYSQQSGYLGLLNVPAGWNIAHGDTNILIADVDGGTYWHHPDLLANVVPAKGWNFQSNTNDPTGSSATPESYAHGTATASMLGAVTDNGTGMAGTSWNCHLIIINAASASADNGIQYGYEGIHYAAVNGARVINCSWGRIGGYSQFEQDVINDAAQRGALVVAAAGNDNFNCDLSPDYPGYYDNVLSVGATNGTDDGRAGFSNFGMNTGTFAPGVDIIGAFVNGNVGDAGAGTSYSSPLVAGLAGLLTSAHPTWTPAQIAMQIRLTSDSIDAASGNSGYAGSLGRGRANFARALTESPAGVKIMKASLRTPAGRTVFVPGDTITVDLAVKNLLATTASNVSFTASSKEAALIPVVTVADGGTLPGGASTNMQFRFTVGSVAALRLTAIKVEWVSNGNTRDAHAFPLSIYPVMPNWLPSSSPTSTSLNSVHSIDDRTVWAAGGDGSATTPVVLRSTDGGNQWMDVTGNLAGVDLYCISATDAVHAWVGTGTGLIYATVDGGTTWTNQPYPGRQSPFIDGVWFFDTQHGSALGDPDASQVFVVLTTTNGGSTWSHASAEPAGVPGEAGWNNSWFWSDPMHGWFGTGEQWMWRTTDGGANWTKLGTAAASPLGLCFRDSLSGLIGFLGGEIEHTTNGGVSWDTAAALSTTNIGGIGFGAGSSMAWVTNGISIFKSTNDGRNWSTDLAAPVTGSFLHMSFADTTGWAVTSNGEILKHGTAIVTSAPPVGNGQAPRGFALRQNYPNPFNPTTAIPLTVTVAERLVVTVYDLLGREVATLANGVKAPGDYVLRFDGAGMSSGMYIVRATASPVDGLNHAQSQAIKIILLK